MTVAERRQRSVETARANDEAVSKILNAGQRRRLGQIALQYQGVRAFGDAYVVAQLKLTPDQRDAVREVERGLFFGGRDGGPRRGDRPPRESMEQRHAAALDRIVQTVLTPKQAAQWREMTGDPVAGGVEPVVGRQHGMGADVHELLPGLQGELLALGGCARAGFPPCAGGSEQ